MASAQKKVIVRQFDGGLAWGYLPQAGLLSALDVSLMGVDGRIAPIALTAIKTISYVRDFNLGDHQDPERLGRKSFAGRPRGDGLWLRLALLDGDTLEGLSSFDTGFLDSLVEDRGIFLTPPDTRANTQRIFVPRPAIASVEVRGVILAPARRNAARRPATAGSDVQPGLFQD